MMLQTKRHLFYSAGVLYDRNIAPARVLPQEIIKKIGICGHASTDDIKLQVLSLLALDGFTKYEVLIDNGGALVTNETISNNLTSVVLQSVSKNRYQLRVENNGRLCTSVTNYIPSNADSLILISPSFDSYQLAVDDDGTLITKKLN